jgi:hypothetical protein
MPSGRSKKIRIELHGTHQLPVYAHDVNIECPALNGNKTKHYISSIIKHIRGINTFSNTGPHKVCPQ